MRQANIERVKFLRQEIAEHDERYYRLAQPTISDHAYDQLKRELESLEKELSLGSSLEKVGDDRMKGFVKRLHKAPMLSLENAYNYEDLQAFEDRLQRLLPNQALSYCVEPKIDGLALSVTYKQGQFLQAITRGNGTEGDDVSKNVQLLELVPWALKAPFPQEVEIRGEVYMRLEEFERLNHEQAIRGLQAYANPRNLTAGTIKLLDAAIVASRKLHFVGYSLGFLDPENFINTQSNLHQILAGWGFETLPKIWCAEGIQQVWKALEELDLLRTEFPYETDGGVVKLESRSLQVQVGQTAKAPRGAIAFKYPPKQGVTQLLDVTFQVGRTGIITPVAELQPVLLSGSTVTRATLHNADEIARKDIRIGDFVVVEKAGDVIPAIVSVVLAKRTDQCRVIVFPANCPSCASRLIQEPNEVAWRCENINCRPQIEGRLLHFGSKSALDIENFGPAVVEQLVGKGWVKKPSDLYRLKLEDLETLEGFKRKAAENLYEALQKSKEAPFWRVLHGLGIPHVGTQTAKDLAKQWPNFLALREESYEGFLKLEGIGPKIAESLVGFFKDSENQILIDELMEIGIGRDVVGSQLHSNLLQDKTFVLTGTLPTLTREAAQELIEKNGGRVQSSVSRKTNYLLCGSDAGSKLQKAEALGIKIIDEEGFFNLL